MFLRQTAARRPAGLYGFEFLPVFYTSADTEYNFTKGCSHRNFYQADIVDLSGQGKYFRPFAFFRTYTAEPFGSFQQDNGDIGIGLHIIHIGRTAFISAFTGERRLDGCFPAKSFHTVYQGCFFTADESSGSITYLNIKRKVRAEDIFTQKSVFLGLLDGYLQSFYGKRIFGTDIDKPFACSGAVSVDSHRFNNRMRITFQDRTIHECTGVAFIGITDYIFLRSLHLPGNLPFESGRETAAPSAPKAAIHDFFDHFIGSHFRKGFPQGDITVTGDVFVDVFRIDETAVA